MIKKYIRYVILLIFLAGIHQGYIAIWEDNAPKPKTILPYSADLLPESDRMALEKGIHLRTRLELTRFIEDFCS